MLLEQDDAVGESCPSQFDSGSLHPMMATMRAELPLMPGLDQNGHGSSSTVAFRGSSSNSSNGCPRLWLHQHSHIQRDEADPPRRARSDWKSRNSQRPSASAMVLARKRKREEQRKLMNSKKQCTDSDGSDRSAGDSERDSLDMDEQLTAFVEYNATDMDSLDINPSQDFDGDEDQDSATQASQCMQTCNWEDVTDVDQFQEEASEVFDNVIYTSRPTSIPVGSSTSTYCRRQGKSDFGVARPPILPTKTKNIPEKGSVVVSLSDHHESSLSDGFDVAVTPTSTIKTANHPSTRYTRCSGTNPKTAVKPQWRQRRSVKRDCSFLDNSNSFSVNGRLLLMASPTPATSSEASQTSSDRVIELKEGCFDSSDNIQEDPMRDSDVSSSVPTSVPVSVDTMTVMSSSLTSGVTYSGAFLVRKRRKVGQLTLDGFLRSKG